MSSRGMSALLVAVLLSAIGCTAPTGTPSDADRSTASPTRSATPRPSPSTSPASRAGCGYLDLPNPAAPAYAGPGPHLAAVHAGLASSSDALIYVPITEYSLPREWRAYGDGDKEGILDPARAQLVVCLTALRKRSETSIGQCEDHPFDVYPASYTFTVFEAKTARKVTTFKIRSEEAVEFSCPSTFQYWAGQAPEFAQGLKDETLHHRLRPLITNPAR